MMKALQYYKYATWLLLALNLAMVAFFLLTRPPHNHERRGGEQEKHDFRNQAIDILALDEVQKEAFLKSVKIHSETMVAIDEQERPLLKKYFQPLLDTTLTIDQVEVMNSILVLEKKKIAHTYQHFSEINTLMRADQEANFADFLQNALEILLLENKKQRPSPQAL